MDRYFFVHDNRRLAKRGFYCCFIGKCVLWKFAKRLLGLCIVRTFFYGYIQLVRAQCFVGGTHNFAVGGQLFQSVSAPAHDPGDGENRCVQFHGQVQHFIYKTGIEVYIDADTLEHLAFL